MAVSRVAVTETPTAVAGLAEDVTYKLQNQGRRAVFVDRSAAAPADNTAAGVGIPATLDAEEYASLASGEMLWAWTREGVSTLAVTEAIS